MNKKGMEFNMLLAIIIGVLVAFIGITYLVGYIKTTLEEQNQQNLDTCFTGDPDNPCVGRLNGDIVEDPTGVCERIKCIITTEGCSYTCDIG